jgi:hypothetical protein
LEAALVQLKKELSQKAVTKDGIKNMLRVFMALEDKYEEVYKPLYAVLTNLEASLEKKD